MSKTKKLSAQDLTELRNRNQMVNQYFLVANSLKDSMQIWMNSKLKEYGVKEGKKCTISFEDGKITDAK